MTKYKVSELEGALLDAAVAKAYGLDYFISSLGVCGVKVDPEKNVVHCAPYEPSTQWSTGGLIIEREGIQIAPVFFEDLVEVAPFTVDYWEATDARTGRRRQGSMPLIASMRAFVASKFEEEVEL